MDTQGGRKICRLVGSRGSATGFSAAIAMMIAPSAAYAEESPEAALTMAATSGQYRVNAGDELDVSVWGEDRMQKTVRVQPDGTFSFPLAGSIKAIGRGVSDI